MKRNATDYRFAAGMFLAVWLALSSPWLAGAVTIPYDAKALFQAQLQFLANALHSGQSPFWNPSSFVGMPQIADPQSLIFSPAFLLAYFASSPSFTALDAYALVVLGFGGFALFKFAQDRGWHPAGAAVAAIAFAFGASAAWRIQHLAQIQSLAFFAISLWLLARALALSSPLFGLLFGLAAGAMLAEPNQVGLLSCYVLAAVVLGHWLMSAEPTQMIRRSVKPLLCGLAGAAAIAAIPLLTTFLFLADSNRPEMTFAEAARGSLHPASLLTAVVADLYGAASPVIDYWGPYSPSWSPNELTLSQNMSQLYLGTLPVLLLLTVGTTRRLLWARDVRILTLAAGLLLLYALGAYTPAFALFFNYLPGVSYFRRPVDAAFLIGALLSILAGYLVHLWASAALPRVSPGKKLLEAGLVAGALVASLAVAYSAGKTGAAWRPIGVAVVWMGASAALLAWPVAWLKQGGRAVVVLPALLLGADLACNNGPNDSTALPVAQYEMLKPNCNNPTVRILKDNLRRSPGSSWRDRVEVVGLGFDWQNLGMVHGFEDTLGYNPFRLGEVSEATGARDYIAGPDQKTFSALFPSYHSMMANLLGLRLIATGAPVEQIDPQIKPGMLKLIAHTGDAFIYENPDALPRVVFASDWSVADFEDLMEHGNWPTFDPLHTVLLDEAPTFDAIIAKLTGPAPAEAAARIVKYENTRVEIEVDAPHWGFLVLHDVWHPWWTAEIDGEEVPIYRANVLFRAVQVPTGRHRVVFEFHPISGAIAELGERLLEPSQ